MSEAHEHLPRSELVYATLMAVFVTFVVLTNTIGVKLFSAGSYVLPVSIIWFPLTFLITDITSEIFGERRSGFLVIMGFAMSVVLLAFVNIGITLPTARVYALGDEYSRVFAPTWRLLFASMAAYLLAQLADVRLFHMFKRLTGGKYLWLRNNGSTMISQLIDTVTVSVIFLYGNDAVFKGSVGDLVLLILNIYVVKVIIALADTPFCYAGVWLIERIIEPGPATTPALAESEG